MTRISATGHSLYILEKHLSAVEDLSQKQEEHSANQPRSVQQPIYVKSMGDLSDIAKSCNLIGLEGLPATGNKSMNGNALGLLPHAD